MLKAFQARQPALPWEAFNTADLCVSGQDVGTELKWHNVQLPAEAWAGHGASVAWGGSLWFWPCASSPGTNV